jgi:hypothetical protein
MYSSISSKIYMVKKITSGPAFFLVRGNLARRKQAKSADPPRGCVNDPRQSRGSALGFATAFS